MAEPGLAEMERLRSLAETGLEWMVHLLQSLLTWNTKITNDVSVNRHFITPNAVTIKRCTLMEESLIERT